MNTGWRAAKGQILWFLNGGDEAFSGEALVGACGLLETNHSVELVSGGATLLRNGHVLYDQPPRAGLLPMLGINRVCQQQLLYRRSLLERLGGFSEEYRIAADYEFHLRAVHAGARQKTCNAVLVRFDRGGISSNISRSFEEFARIHRSLREKGQLKYGFMHIFVRSLELFRIRFLRILDDLGIGIYLRKIWHSFRRSIRK